MTNQTGDPPPPAKGTPDDRALDAALYGESLARIIENNVDGMVVVDGRGMVLFANPSAGRMLGCAADELPGEMLGLPVSDGAADVQLNSGNGQVVHAEMRPVDIVWQGSPATLVCLRDVTEHVRAELELARTSSLLEQRVVDNTFALRRANHLLEEEVQRRANAQQELGKSRARYKAILADQTELICRYLPDGRLSYVNEAYARYFGKTVDELLDTNFIPHIPAPDMDHVKAHIGSLCPDEPVCSFEHRVVMPSGETRWQHWTHRAVYASDGRLVEYQAVGRDITRQKETELELAEQHAFLQLIVNTVPTPIFVKDAKGRFVMANRAMAERYGTTPDALIGKTGADFNPDPEEIARFKSEDRQVLATRRPLEIPQRTITGPDGQTRWFATTKLPIPGKDQLLGVAMDVTGAIQAEAERREIDQRLRQSQKMQALGTLAGGIAHDFNNMLHAIMGFAGLALRGCDPDSKTSTYLEQIRSAGLRASELVRQILTFSRQAERGKTRVDMAELAAEVLEMLSATAPKNVTIETRFGEDGAVVLADPAQLHQVVLNICTNALHAMRNGGKLTVGLGLTSADEDLGPELEAGEYVRLTIADTGEGIDPAVAERIFEPFFTTKPKGEGTGMGLSVVHGIVQNHGGTVRMQSKPGRGSTFTVYLPHFSGSFETAPEPRQSVSGAGQRVLVVDDEPMLADLAEQSLAGAGYRVTSTTSPAQALELFSRDPRAFDVVVTDQAMPGLTGMELAGRMIRLKNDLPVVLLTGFAGDLSRDIARQVGIRELVRKPAGAAELTAAVSRALAEPD